MNSTAEIVKYDIVYNGDVVGLNHYKSLHWRNLKTKIDGFKWAIKPTIIKAKLKPLAWMELTVFHNTRFDLDNIVGIVKPFVDMLRERKILEDDTKQYWDNLRIAFDPKLKKGTVLFQITGELKL